MIVSTVVRTPNKQDRKYPCEYGDVLCTCAVQCTLDKKYHVFTVYYVHTVYMIYMYTYMEIYIDYYAMCSTCVLCVVLYRLVP